MKNLKWAMQFLAILHLVGCKTNDQIGMVLTNLQKAFDIINQKILLKKMYSFGFSANQLLVFLVSVVPLLTNLQVSIFCPIKHLAFNVF